MSLSEQITFWEKVKGCPLSSFEQVVVARPFKYSAYWQRWSRVLKPVYGGNPRGYVEFSIQPDLPGWENSGPLSTNLARSISEIRSIRIRHHSTTPDKNDRYASQPPDAIIAAMRLQFGEDETQFMLYGSIFDRIDWVRYQRTPTLGGGIPLAECALT